MRNTEQVAGWQEEKPGECGVLGAVRLEGSRSSDVRAADSSRREMLRALLVLGSWGVIE